MAERPQIKAYKIELNQKEKAEDKRCSEQYFFADGYLQENVRLNLIKEVAYNTNRNVIVYMLDKYSRSHFELITGISIIEKQGAPLEGILLDLKFTPGIGSRLNNKEKAQIRAIASEYKRKVLSHK